MEPTLKIALPLRLTCPPELTRTFAGLPAKVAEPVPLTFRAPLTVVVPGPPRARPPVTEAVAPELIVRVSVPDAVPLMSQRPGEETVTTVGPLPPSAMLPPELTVSVPSTVNAGLVARLPPAPLIEPPELTVAVPPFATSIATRLANATEPLAIRAPFI